MNHNKKGCACPLQSTITLKTPISILLIADVLFLIPGIWEIWLYLDNLIDLVIIVVTVLITSFAHELIHKFVYICNNISAKILWWPTPACKCLAPCSIRVFRVSLLSPLFLTLFWGMCCIFMAILDNPNILFHLFLFNTLFALFSSVSDLYWFFKLIPFNNSYIIINHGWSAEITRL
ncbi:MAG: hypothetical protein A4E53_00130 [Pelotomaculum sp. PtaB.Bin104]|nr:MAG: hypothetical protein A4E53_00130 [Pelotomaculum sp. PtaB.Bin104]